MSSATTATGSLGLVRIRVRRTTFSVSCPLSILGPPRTIPAKFVVQIAAGTFLVGGLFTCPGDDRNQVDDGGRLQISDIALRVPVSDQSRADPRLWAECVVGAITEDNYVSFLRAGMQT